MSRYPTVYYESITLERRTQEQREFTVKLYEDQLLNVHQLVNPYHMEVRIDGLFAGRAIYLTDAYDWVLGKDDKGCLVLIPIKK